MDITSPAFSNDEYIPETYACKGDNVSPPLEFANVLHGTASLALVCHDPDAPGAEGWTHWVVWNIPPDAGGFEQGEIPDGAVQGTTDRNENKWGGPLPPSGTHRYIFYLYALNTELDLPNTTTRNDLEHAMQGHVLETATLTGLFSAE